MFILNFFQDHKRASGIIIALCAVVAGLIFSGILAKILEIAGYIIAIGGGLYAIGFAISFFVKSK